MRMLALHGSFWGLHLLPWSGCCWGGEVILMLVCLTGYQHFCCRPAPSLRRLQTVKELACPFLKFLPTVRNSLRTERRQEPTVAQVVGGPKSQTSSHLCKLIHILSLTNLSLLIWPKSTPHGFSRSKRLSVGECVPASRSCITGHKPSGSLHLQWKCKKKENGVQPKIQQGFLFSTHPMLSRKLGAG